MHVSSPFSIKVRGAGGTVHPYHLVVPSKVETVPKKMRLAKKDASNKKSTILFQIAEDSGNITYSWASHFDKVS